MIFQNVLGWCRKWLLRCFTPEWNQCFSLSSPIKTSIQCPNQEIWPTLFQSLLPGQHEERKSVTKTPKFPEKMQKIGKTGRRKKIKKNRKKRNNRSFALPESRLIHFKKLLHERIYVMLDNLYMSYLKWTRNKLIRNVLHYSGIVTERNIEIDILKLYLK